MRGPIAYGLAWPHRVESGAAALDFSAMAALTFESVDCALHRSRFPGLRLAWDALKALEGTTAILNAANEIAVDAFLGRRIRFDQIHEVNVRTVEHCEVQEPGSLEELLELDELGRRSALSVVNRLAG
jgi:1-deoxy-D-xylulose-5-phosphate reductoisomerase